MQQVSEGLDIMPPFGAAFTAEEIHDVSAYIVNVLPHQGRPLETWVGKRLNSCLAVRAS